MRRCNAGALAVAALLGLLGARADATVLVGADLGELARDAGAIARGHVVAVDARWTEDRRTVETIVTLQVETYLKGSFGDTLQFRVPGGVLGRLRSVVVGAPTFAVDDRVIVFLAATGPAIPHIVGFSQGVFRVVEAQDRDRWIVSPPPLAPVAATTTVARGDLNRRTLPLGVFEQRVRGLVAGAK